MRPHARHSSSRHASSQSAPRVSRAILRLAVGSLVVLVGLPAIGAAPSAPSSPGRLWETVKGPVAPVHDGHRPALVLDRFRPVVLDHARMARVLAQAPIESAAAGTAIELSLPAPDGGRELFAIVESPVMEPGLARRHPEISTYAGRGLTDPTATIRISSTPLGFQASVRGQEGSWYVDPYYHLDRSLYASYFARDLQNSHGPLTEPGPIESPDGHEHEAEAAADADALDSTGGVLRTYRLALASDPEYARYFGADNVTAAKVALVNRVTQIYEDETSIRMILVAENDRLNFNTVAMATGPNGPCGAAACYTSLSSCSGSLLDRNRIVVGQLIGASNFDIGHIGMGTDGGGVAYLGVVGGDRKAGGCTGVIPPTGDFFAVDYVAHEMGHQYAGNHTFNGTNGSCAATNRNGPNSVEPGSGSSIMAYAGICLTDDLQAHSDPYWSQRSFQEITTYVTSSRAAIAEVQSAVFQGFNGSDSFTVTYEGKTSPVVTRGVNYTATGISAAVRSVLPTGATVSVANFGGGGSPSDSGFQLTFSGTLAQKDVSLLTLNPSGFTGFINEIANGGPIENQGWQITPTGNSLPAVSAPASFTIPYQTPFALTATATDPDGDDVTYMWEQNNIGTTPDALHNPAKTTGPLFRQFGVGQDASKYNPQQYNSPGENHPTSDPTRVFPDMQQILVNNTNAGGACPGGVPEAIVDCYSEYLPTPEYRGPMNFRVTVRDHSPGGAGVSSANTVVNLAPGTGPFLVVSPNAQLTVDGGSTQTVAWSPAGTNLPPISTANVEILLSIDGGESFPYVLAASTANDGAEDVVIPDIGTTEARIMVRAVGNVFFDVSNADFTIDQKVERADLELVSHTGSPDPAYAGETLDYTIVTRNNGPSAVSDARVVVELPSELSYASSTVPCTEDPADTLTCDVGTLARNAQTTFAVTASIPRGVVHEAGSPINLSSTATVGSGLPDPDAGNNAKTATTLVKAKADLGITSQVLDPPTALMVGEPRTVTLRSEITNGGPSAPMDVVVDRAASATSNASVSPATSSVATGALGYQESRVVTHQFELRCTGPGHATFTFETDVAPARTDDVDPNGTNNGADTAVTVECIVPVAINIHPGSSTNPVSLSKKGEVPVGVLTTLAGEYGLPLAFDATKIDATSVRFGPEAVVLAGGGAQDSDRRGQIQDILERSDETTRDGDLDNLLRFRTKDSQLTGNETRACVRGVYGPGQFVFFGCDKVTL